MAFDEAIYRTYLLELDTSGLSQFPELCDGYIADQREAASAVKLPPTRLLYVYTSWLWKRVEFGDAPPAVPKTPGFTERDPALLSLHRVACLWSCLVLAMSGLCACRMFGARAFLPVLALMAFSPLEIHFAQHALVDGFFTFWAMLSLWLLWENLRRPDSAVLLAGYAASLALLVITKENAFFVWAGLVGLLAVSRWAKFGEVTSKLVLASIAGPLTGVTILVTLAGGVGNFLEIYTLLVSKAHSFRYAIMTGDGPWYRYLVDLLTLSPIVLLLAIGGLFTQLKANRAYGYLGVFVAVTYAIMCNVKYGLNLRYTSIWDLPIRAFAAGQVGALTARLPRRADLATALVIAALCVYDWRQYTIFFSDSGLYELVPEGMLRAVKILK